MASENRLPGPLDLTGNAAENCRRFSQEFEIYLLSTEKDGKKDEVKIATLLHCGGRELLDIYNTLPIDDEKKKDYKNLLDELHKYFEPKKYVTYERYLFNSRVQQPDENIDNFVTDLRKRAKNCNFGTLKDELIRDRIICGICNEQLRGRLLRHGDSTLEEVVQLCRAQEASAEQLKELSGAVNAVNINIVRGRKKDNLVSSTPVSPTTLRTCKFCGYKHVFGRIHCPATNKECLKCGRKGHFQSRCEQFGPRQTRDSTKERRIKYAEREEVDSSDSEAAGNEKQVGNLCIRKKKRTVNAAAAASSRESKSKEEDEDLLKLKINGKNILFQIDTGAQVSVLPRLAFETLGVGSDLQKTKTVLVAFNGSKIKPLGKCQLLCSYGSSTYQLIFYVVDAKCVPLLSKNACKLLGAIKFMNKVNENAAMDKQQDQLIVKYHDVFEGLGCLDGELHLEVDPNVSPVAHPPRKVPVALRERLKCELTDMEAQGVM